MSRRSRPASWAGVGGGGQGVAEGDILSRCRRDEASERAELCRRWEEVGEPWTQSWPCHTSPHWNVLRPEQAGALQDTALSPQKSEAKWGPGYLCSKRSHATLVSEHPFYEKYSNKVRQEITAVIKEQIIPEPHHLGP